MLSWRRVKVLDPHQHRDEASRQLLRVTTELDDNAIHPIRLTLRRTIGYIIAALYVSMGLWRGLNANLTNPTNSWTVMNPTRLAIEPLLVSGELVAGIAADQLQTIPTGQVPKFGSVLVIDKTQPFPFGCVRPSGIDAVAFYTKQLQTSVLVDKDVSLVLEESTFSEAVAFQRLSAFDYDEVKGLVAIFQNAFLTGSTMDVFDCNVKYHPGGCNNGASIFGGAFLVPELVHAEKKNKKGVYISLSQHWCDGFYHFLAECLPRLAMVHEYLISHPDVKIVAHYSTFMDTSRLHYLHLLGIDPETRMLLVRENSVHFFERLLVPTSTACGRANKRAARIINSKFRQELPKFVRDIQNHTENLRNSNVTLPVYIVVQDRGTSSSRHVRNHKEMIEAIRQKFGNDQKRIVIEEFSPQDSNGWYAKAIHYRANILIGPHGAGLANVMMMKPDKGSHVLEIYPIDGMGTTRWINPCHRITSEALGIEHRMIMSETGSHSSSMDVDPEKVVQALQEIMAEHYADALP